MPEDTPGEEQRTMLSFTEAADRLVEDGIAESMTPEGLRRLARDPLSGWPIGPDDYRVVGKTRMLPYELLVPYMQTRKRARGPAKQPRKKRHFPPQQQGVPVTTTVDARKDLYAFAMQGKEHSPAVSEKASERINAFRAAVVAEVVEALTAKAQERSAEAEEEMRRDLEEQAQVWHDAATVAGKLKRAKTEAQGG